MNLLPTWLKWLALAALLAVIGAQWVGIAHLRAARATDQAAWATERQRAAERLAAAERDYRNREQAIAADHQEQEHAAQARIAALAADLERGRAAADGLRRARDAAVAAARKAAGCAAAQPGGADRADDPIGVLADVFGRSDARAGALAAEADRRGIAHAACVGEYEAVRARINATGAQP